MNCLPLHFGINSEQQAVGKSSGEMARTNLVLPADVREYVRAALSESSRRAYRADLDQFIGWGGSIPTSPDVIARYLAAHAGQQAISTLARRLVSIAKAHTSQGYPSPADSDLVRATLRGIRMTHGSKQRQVSPVEREDILQMVAGLSGTKGIRDKAILLIGFAGAFRRSELVSLRIEDIEEAKQGLLIHLRRSKTDQAGVGRKIAIPFARGAVCPVKALQDWLKVAGISGGAVFRPVNRHGHILADALTPQSVALLVKTRAKAIGLHPDRFSGHSLRAGLVTSAAKLGVSSWKIREQTGHKSDAMLARYIRDANIFVDNAAGAVL